MIDYLTLFLLLRLCLKIRFFEISWILPVSQIKVTCSFFFSRTNVYIKRGFNLPWHNADKIFKVMGQYVNEYTYSLNKYCLVQGKTLENKREKVR